MEPHPSLEGLCFGLVRGLYPVNRTKILQNKLVTFEPIVIWLQVVLGKTNYYATRACWIMRSKINIYQIAL